MILGALSAMLLGSALAQPPEIPLADAPEGFGVGLVSGHVSGLALALRPDSMHTLSGAAGWSLSEARTNLHGDYQYSYGQVTIEPGSDIVLRLSAGLGAFANLYDSYSQFGVRVPLDFTLIPGPRPFDLFMQVAPALALYPDTLVRMQWAVGTRIYFK